MVDYADRYLSLGDVLRAREPAGQRAPCRRSWRSCCCSRTSRARSSSRSSAASAGVGGRSTRSTGSGARARRSRSCTRAGTRWTSAPSACASPSLAAALGRGLAEAEGDLAGRVRPAAAVRSRRRHAPGGRRRGLGRRALRAVAPRPARRQLRGALRRARRRLSPRAVGHRRASAPRASGSSCECGREGLNGKRLGGRAGRVGLVEPRRGDHDARSRARDDRGARS